MTAYQEFKAALAASNCPKCPALCAARHNIVVDRGNPDARIMAIGEAPGENEDLQGRAFVGRGGQLFDKIMASVGLDTNRDLLIANVLKCRPPDNRPPTPEEAANCRPFLLRQIDLVRPRLIVLLGATAAKYFTNNELPKPMKDRVGRFFQVSEHPGIEFQVHYHPAYLLRDPRKQPEARSHAEALRRRLEELGIAPAAIPK